MESKDPLFQFKTPRSPPTSCLLQWELNLMWLQLLGPPEGPAVPPSWALFSRPSLGSWAAAFPLSSAQSFPHNTLQSPSYMQFCLHKLSHVNFRVWLSHLHQGSAVLHSEKTRICSCDSLQLNLIHSDCSWILACKAIYIGLHAAVFKVTLNTMCNYNAYIVLLHADVDSIEWYGVLQTTFHALMICKSLMLDSVSRYQLCIG